MKIFIFLGTLGTFQVLNVASGYKTDTNISTVAKIPLDSIAEKEYSRQRVQQVQRSWGGTLIGLC